jgi:hypothetical protein
MFHSRLGLLNRNSPAAFKDAHQPDPSAVPSSLLKDLPVSEDATAQASTLTEFANSCQSDRVGRQQDAPFIRAHNHSSGRAPPAHVAGTHPYLPV